MKNLFLCICLLVTSFLTFAKVAYLPVAKNEFGQISEKSLIVLDLDSGNVIKNINFGVEISAIFLNDVGDKLYEAAHLDNTIFLVDTTTLAIVNQWNNLPVGPSQIVLNANNDKLFFISRFNTTGDATQLYSLDLTTNQTNTIFSFAGETTEYF